MQRELFNLIDYHLLNDNNPAIFLNKIDLNIKPFTMLEKLKFTEQSPIYHPEGSVWNHTMLVVEKASALKQKSTDSRVFMWAALFHDIGKIKTTKLRKGKITSYNHDIVGAELTLEFFNYFNENKYFVKKVSDLVLWHMQILTLSNNNYSKKQIEKIKNAVNINDLLLLSTCDRLGRTNIDFKKELEKIKLFKEKIGG